MITLIDSSNDKMEQETAAMRTDRVETKDKDKIMSTIKNCMQQLILTFEMCLAAPT